MEGKRYRSSESPYSPIVHAQHRACRPLTLEDEVRYAKRWRKHEDPRALDALVGSCLALVVKIAFSFRFYRHSVEDLMQEGNVGLVLAAKRFDPSRGARLATYATWWIRAMILAYVVQNHGSVSLGKTRTVQKLFFGLGHARRKLEAEGQKVEIETLAAEMGIADQHLDLLVRLCAKDFSLDASMYDQAQDWHGVFLTDEASSEAAVSDGLDRATLRQLLHQVMGELDPRERRIIERRYFGDKVETLKSLGHGFGVSRERVRQIESNAKGKLKNHPKIRQVRSLAF